MNGRGYGRRYRGIFYLMPVRWWRTRCLLPRGHSLNRLFTGAPRAWHGIAKSGMAKS